MFEAPGLVTIGVDALWQGVLLAAMVELAVRSIRLSARSRYLIWCSTFLAISLLPLVRLVAFGPANVVSGGQVSSAGEMMGRVGTLQPWVWLPESHAGWIGASLVVLLTIGGARSLMLVLGIASSRGLVRRSSALPPEVEAEVAAAVDRFGSRDVRVRMSAEVASPATIGLGKPTVLLPAAKIRGLTSAEWSLIVLHELGHVRRRDDWVNLGQRLIGRTLFFVPGVQWAGRRVDLAREMACDEFARSGSGGGMDYARVLVKIARLKWERTPALAPGILGGASQLAIRVDNLLHAGFPARNPSPLRAWAGSATIAVAAALLALVPGVGFVRHYLTIEPVIAAIRPTVAAPAGLEPDRWAIATAVTEPRRPAIASNPGPAEAAGRPDDRQIVPELALVSRCDGCIDAPRGIATRLIPGAAGPGIARRAPAPPIEGRWEVDAPVRVSIQINDPSSDVLSYGSAGRQAAALPTVRWPRWLRIDVAGGSRDWNRVR